MTLASPRSPLVALLAFWAFIALFKFGSALHYTLLPAFGERVLPVATVGILIAVAAFVQFLLDVPAGFLIDRFGYRRFLAVTIACFLTAGGILAFGLSPWTFLGTLALSILGWLFFEPAVNAYLLACIPHAFAGRAMALRDTLDSAGVALAAGVFSFLLGVPVPLAGSVFILAFAASAIALTFVPRECASVHTEQKLTTHHHYVRRTFLPNLLRAFRRLNPASTMLLVSGFAASTFYGVVWFVVPVLVGRATASGIPGIGLGVFDATIVLVGFLIGRVVDRSNVQRFVFFGLLLFAFAGTILGFSIGVWFILLGFLATAGDELSSISLWAWMHRLDQRHTEDAAISGAIAAIHDLGWTVGPLLAGLLFEPIGPSWTIAVGALGIFAAWIACAAMLGFRRSLTLMAFPSPLPPFPHPRRHKR